ncbi:hybrid sensor histidine kinase/response regulator [Chitinophaga varians]|nr:hybrid sensor histidine kinase/response regulator [Chitinophaga varians]
MIIQKITSKLEPFTHVGSYHLAEPEKSRVITANTVYLSSAFLATITGVCFYFICLDQKILWPALLEGILFTTCYQLTKHRRRVLGGIIFTATHCIAVLYYGILFGFVLETELLVVFLVMVPFLLFKDRKIRRGSIFFTVLAFIALELNQEFDFIRPVELDHTVRKLFHYLGLLVVIGLIILVVWKMVSRTDSYSENLEKQVAQRTLQLAEANKYKTEFIQSLSHDVRAPLIASLQVAENLQTQLTDENQQGGIAKLHAFIKLCLGVAGNVIELTRIETGNLLSSTKSPINLSNWFNNNTELLKVMADRKRVNIIDVICDGTPDWIEADEVALTKIMINLVSNAIKFSPRNKSVVVQLEATQSEIKLQVTDCGIGIAHEPIDEIFNLYFTGDKKRGTGIGLYISKKLAVQLGGDLKATNNAQGGATFTLKIPCSAPTAKPNVVTYHPEENLSDHTALVVEDEEMAAHIISRILKDLGCTEVVRVASGEEAINLFRNKTYDIFILDGNLPDTPGIELLHEIKKRQHLKDSAVIITTSNAVKEAIDDFMEAGADGYFIKPVGPETKPAILKACKKEREIIY